MEGGGGEGGGVGRRGRGRGDCGTYRVFILAGGCYECFQPYSDDNTSFAPFMS